MIFLVRSESKSLEKSKETGRTVEGLRVMWKAWIAAAGRGKGFLIRCR